MLAVFEYHLTTYKRVWRGSALSTFVLPLLTVLGFGLGVGEYIDGGVDGVRYLDWIVPGLIASTVMQVAIFESTWPVLSSFNWVRSYEGQAATPVRLDGILGGNLLYVLFRALTGAVAFLVVAAVFGALHSWWALAVLPISLLLALAFAAPAFAYSSSVPSDSYLALLFRFAVIPMSLFAGVFFPVESLPVGLRWLAYASPLWHGVDLSRAATLGGPAEWSVTGHVLYLALWAGGGYAIARVRFKKRLVV
ncbi:ABC transporter permease [Phytohabitans sp. LJ34]|uniref:ABC transporter permease n=1 Tax=Phytohabitans sp. LJ34 TaxID=3452217 RepID=UPI003F8AD975